MVQSVNSGALGVVVKVNRALAKILKLWGEEAGQHIVDYVLMITIILTFLLSTIWLIGWSAR